MVKIILFITCILLGQFATAGVMKITINGFSNETIIVAYYYGDKQYVLDTLKLNENGQASKYFDSTNHVGLYLAVFPKLRNQYFEFIQNNDTLFEFATDTSDLIGNMVVAGSLENALFYKYLQCLKHISDNTAYRVDNKLNRAVIDSAVTATCAKLIGDYPATYCAKLFRAMQPTILSFDNKDSSQAYTSSHYQKQYWDSIDLHDERLVYSPVIAYKLKKYLKGIMTVDSLINASEHVLKLTGGKGEVFKYTLDYIFNEVNEEASDNHIVCTYLKQKYYCDSLRTPWLTKKQRNAICSSSCHNQYSDLPHHICNNIVLWSDSMEQQAVTLWGIKAKYTILFFWNPLDSISRVEYKKITDVVDSLELMDIDVKLYAASTGYESSYEAWVNTTQNNNSRVMNVCDLHQHSRFRYDWSITKLPLIYILDRQKVIKAKGIDVGMLQDYIHHLHDPDFVSDKLKFK